MRRGLHLHERADPLTAVGSYDLLPRTGRLYLMNDGSEAFPPLHEYALAHRCSRCKAQPGEACYVPRKQAGIDRRNRIREGAGLPLFEPEPLSMMHANRIDAGIRHRRKDVVAAPWPEDREPGRRYHTLGEGYGQTS